MRSCRTGSARSTPRRLAGGRLGVSRHATTVQLCSLDDPRRGPIEVDELRRYGYEAELVVPLIAKGRVIGVADLLDRERREFSPGTVGAVEAVCRAAAFAIDNANLFEAVQLRSRETELLNAIARRTASSLELHEIAAATVEELRQIVAFERAELILADGGERLETIYSSDEQRHRGRAARRERRTARGARGHPPRAGGRLGRRRGAELRRQWRRGRRGRREHRAAARRPAHRRARPHRLRAARSSPRSTATSWSASARIWRSPSTTPVSTTRSRACTSAISRP